MADSFADYKEKVLGCWLGKSIGGTLGVPFEGKDGPLSLKFYDPVPTEMLPNDDLDLQIVWACAMAKMERPRVDKDVLAKAWLENVGFPWDEYGVAIRNLKRGVRPPLSGAVDNRFTRGMGAAIRSELWACLAPGDPVLAAQYAYEDACVDHAGEGIWAEVLLAAMEAAAFSLSDDPAAVIDAGLCLLPPDSEIRAAVCDTRAWWDASPDLLEVRERILSKYGSGNFTDVTQNLAFIALSLLSGAGDFSKTICDAVNCGKDTDCTGATAGAIFGIMNPSGIGQEWLAPIGRKIVLSKQIVGVDAPKTIDGFTDMVVDLRAKLEASRIGAKAIVRPVKAEIGFASAKLLEGEVPLEGELREKLLKALKPVSLPGACASLPPEAFKSEAAVVRYLFEEPSGARRRVMLNASVGVKVWIDGAFSFKSGPKPMVPSFHRCPQGHFADVDLSKGQHEAVALLERPPKGVCAEWAFGVGEHPSMQWTEAF